MIRCKQDMHTPEWEREEYVGAHTEVGAWRVWRRAPKCELAHGKVSSDENEKNWYSANGTGPLRMTLSEG